MYKKIFWTIFFIHIWWE